MCMCLYTYIHVYAQNEILFIYVKTWREGYSELPPFDCGCPVPPSLGRNEILRECLCSETGQGDCERLSEVVIHLSQGS